MTTDAAAAHPEGFEFFPWTPHFDTGIDAIDTQHRKLVALLNQLAQQYVDGATPEAMQGVLTDLIDYADYHFRTEEAIWHQALDGADSADRVTSHEATHRAFFAHMADLQAHPRPLNELLHDLFGYLSNWLAFHILDSDKRLAKATLAVQAGHSLVQAHAQAEADMRGAAATLIQAVLDMYRKLSSQALNLMHERHARVHAQRGLQAALQERDQQQGAIELVAQLLARPLGHEQDDLQTLLAHTAQTLGVERAHIFLFDQARLGWPGVHAWHQAGTPPISPEMGAQGLQKYMPWWIDQLQQHGAICMADTRHVPAGMSEVAAELRALGVCSLCSVPLLQGSELMGVLSVHSLHAGRLWAESDLRWLRLMAHLICARVQRQRAEQAHSASKERFEALFDMVSDAVLVVDDATGQLVAANAEAARLFGCTVAQLEQKHASELHPPEETQRLRAWLNQSSAQGAAPSAALETWVLNAQGLQVPVEISRGRRYSVAGRHYQIGVLRDISERSQTQAELERHRLHLSDMVQERTAELALAKDAAEAANRAKSSFLASMSHEIHTPLNAMLGFAQRLERDPSLGPAPREQARIIMRSGQHLLELIDDVLDLSKIEAGHMALKLSDFDLHSLLDDVLGMFTLPAQAKGLHLHLERAPDLPQAVHGDKAKLRQVLINLLSNAVKFTRQGTVRLCAGVGPVEASQQSGPAPGQQQRLWVQVHDQGPGVGPAEQALLFQPFSQAAAGKKSGSGSGLGLSICRKLLQIMGGDIALQSSGSQGSCFCIELPITPVQAGHVPRPGAGPQAATGPQLDPDALVHLPAAMRQALVAALQAGDMQAFGRHLQPCAVSEPELCLHLQHLADHFAYDELHRLLQTPGTNYP